MKEFTNIAVNVVKNDFKQFTPLSKMLFGDNCDEMLLLISTSASLQTAHHRMLGVSTTLLKENSSFHNSNNLKQK